MYIKGCSTLISLETYPCIYASVMVEKLKKTPINIKQITLKSGEETVDGSGSKTISGTKLYMTDEGKIE